MQYGITGPEKLKLIESFLSKRLTKNQEYLVLDGGGTKFTSKKISQFLPNSKIVSLNLSREDLKGVSYGVIGDVEKVNRYFNAEFDVILLNDVIEHLLKPITALSKCKKIMKEDGVLILTTPNLASFYNRIFLLLGFGLHNYNPGEYFGGINYPLRKTRKKAVSHKSVFTFRGLKKVLRGLGFKVLSIEGFTYGQEIKTGVGGEVYPLARKILDKILPKSLKEGTFIAATRSLNKFG